MHVSSSTCVITGSCGGKYCICLSLAHLSEQNQVWSGSCQSSNAPNACRITHTQQESFTHPLPVLLHITQLLQLLTAEVLHRYNHYNKRTFALIHMGQMNGNQSENWFVDLYTMIVDFLLCALTRPDFGAVWWRFVLWTWLDSVLFVHLTPQQPFLLRGHVVLWVACFLWVALCLRFPFNTLEETHELHIKFSVRLQKKTWLLTCDEFLAN